MSEKTQAEIDAEIKALEACKSYVPRKTAFGEDNHVQLDLQIEELRDGIDDSSQEFEDYSQRDQSAILEARSWKEGDEANSPSSGWDSFKKKSQGKK